jgi:hypothetical protein
MNWIKKIFGFKEKEQKEQVRQEQIEPIIPEQPRRKESECFYCKNPILIGEKWSKQQGNYFHRKCYKEMLKGF